MENEYLDFEDSPTQQAEFNNWYANKYPPVSLPLIIKEGRLSRDNYHYGEIKDCLIANGYTDLGWANSGAKHPDYEMIEVYCSYTGANTMYVSHEHKTIYSVDMS